MKEQKIVANINNITRKLILNYIEKHEMTLNKFCMEAKLHQSNIHMFLKGGSINTTTIERIGKFLELNK